MRVVLLGTGSADGWPNAFCRCESCLALRERGELRTPTSVLVDGQLLIDCGPEAPRQALRAGTDLTYVRDVLISHAHTDHFDPAFLLYRSWVSSDSLRLWGPQPVIEAARHWLDPSSSVVELNVVTAGDEVQVGDYQVRVLAAAHEAFGEAVLYDISDGRYRILYACDTGPIDLTVHAQNRYDLVLAEETFGTREDPDEYGHHNLRTFSSFVHELRQRGAIDDRSRTIAVHLSHHNPPDVADYLSSIGVDVVGDGTLIRLADDFDL